MRSLQSFRGAIPIVVLYVLGGLAATQLVPNWRLGNVFRKGPQTEQLAKAQAELEKTKAEAATAKAAYEAALKAQQQATVEQVRFSQQFAAGIPPLLAKAPQTPEVQLAQSFASRVNKGLALAIGDLPAGKQAEILQIIQEALSAKQEEVNAANAKVAVLDAQLAVTTKEKAVLDAQLPVLRASNAALQTKVEAETATVTQVTAKVTEWAEKAQAREKEAGSLGALVHKLLVLLAVIAALYLFAHLMLPSLAQEFPAARWLVGLNKTVKSITSAHQ